MNESKREVKSINRRGKKNNEPARRLRNFMMLA
jgi:hypothetical protein